MKPIADYKKDNKTTVVKTVNITIEQEEKIQKESINFSRLIRDLLSEYFKSTEKRRK